MSNGRILYTSSEVRRAVTDLFSSSRGRRVAITAFVGASAEAYLPKPEGIKLYCWPKAGGTNPVTIRKLMHRGVRVSFIDSLHMKVYWAEDKGAVITSANLSTNALGSGNLSEAGVLLPPGQLKIKRLLSNLRSRPVTGSELRKIDKAHHDYEMGDRLNHASAPVVSFAEWYSLPHKPIWKIDWWDGEAPFAKKAIEIVRDEYDLRAPHEYAAASGKNDYGKREWVLYFGLQLTKPTQVHWLNVDFVVLVSRSDPAYDPNNRYQAIQVWPLNRYPAPPFKIDRRFRDALSQAVQFYGADTVKSWTSAKPTKQFVDTIYKYF